MMTAKAPASVRDQAYAILRARLPDRTGNPQEPVLGADAAVIADLLVDLERRFGIALDPDELWRTATAADLVALVERKLADRARTALLPANQNAAIPPPQGELSAQPTEGASSPALGDLIDRARARRARGETLPPYMPSHDAIDRHLTQADLYRWFWTGFWLAVGGCVLGAVGYTAIALAGRFS